MTTNFHLAPPSKVVDGLLAVPVDIQTVQATLLFNGSTQTSTADATIQYTVGPTTGNPIFDLRQHLSQAWLDGAPFPVAQLALHNFGGGAFTELRIIEAAQTAGSVHTLRVQYNLGLPLSQLAGSYPPALTWAAGPELRFSFGLSDLNAGRYLEAWLPANLIFDQYTISLEIRITHTLTEHTVITNGQVTSLGFNHWQIRFPSRFTALSPLLEVRATHTLVFLADTVSLPVSGKLVTVEAWKLTGAAVNLTTQINNIKSFLIGNETNYGPYLHENRFVAFFNVGGMEYEGGTTTTPSALLHETFHSWFARGVKPSGQADGWWDEAYTQYHDAGADDATPFDFSDLPVLLCSRNPWQRRTPGNSYSDGAAFWRGVTALIGVGSLNSIMSDFYNKYKGQPVSTEMLEEFLVCKAGNPQLTDAFHQFVYGFTNPSPAPELWLKDHPAHTSTNGWTGDFWNSPDLWVRNQDDGGTTHQPPEYGQDNWFYARIRNKSAAGIARHFVVTFNAKSFAGTQFVYPSDFLPCIAAKAAFELGPGETMIVKAKWPRSLVPPAGTHSCILASVITRADHPASGLHVWEHNNLAQKNLTVVNLKPDSFIIIPVVISHTLGGFKVHYFLEVLRKTQIKNCEVSIVHKSEEFFDLNKGAKLSHLFSNMESKAPERLTEELDCGGHIPNLNDRSTPFTSDKIDLIVKNFPNALQAFLPSSKRSRIQIKMDQFSQVVIGLKIAISSNSKKGEVINIDLVQRHVKTNQVTGGIAVEIKVS